MTQPVHTLPEQPPVEQTPTPRPPETQISRRGIISLLVMSGLLLLLFTGLLIGNLPQTVHPHNQPETSSSQANIQAPDGPLSTLGSSTQNLPLQLPEGHGLLFEAQNKIFLVPMTGANSAPQALTTPGYTYNRAVPPILTPSGQLLYSGNGLWLTDLSSGTPKQIATLPQDQVITSMVLSSDGTTLAWSSAPANGDGSITVYAGPLHAVQQVYQQQADACPCFRAFSFLNDSKHQSNTTLLLADDRGDHHAVQFGLWTLDLSQPANPLPLLDAEPQQGPLAHSAQNNLLLYSDNEGNVPAPTDDSAPDEVAPLSYANSLYLASLNNNTLDPTTSYELLAEQGEQRNMGGYRWVTTPTFSPDGQTLTYIVFSSDAQAPFDRHSALYTVHISGSSQHPQIQKPQLLATANSRFIELGAWLDTNILTFYADGKLYALDTRTGSVATIANPGSYARIITVTDQP